jgi:3'-5' exoribonuclease
VSMSAVMVQEAAGKAKVTGPKLQQLLHIVLSHHGEQEKGSPVACATKESFIVHYADEIDAIMNQFSKNEGKNPWEYNKMLQRFLLHEA